MFNAKPLWSVHQEALRIKLDIFPWSLELHKTIHQRLNHV